MDVVRLVYILKLAYEETAGLPARYFYAPELVIAAIQDAVFDLLSPQTLARLRADGKLTIYTVSGCELRALPPGEHRIFVTHEEIQHGPAVH